MLAVVGLGAKPRFYDAAKDAKLVKLIKVDLHAAAFSFTNDQDKPHYVELIDGKLLLVTNTDTLATKVVQRCESLTDIEQGFRMPDIEIGSLYHRRAQRNSAHALVCLTAPILYRVMRMRLKANAGTASPSRLLE